MTWISSPVFVLLLFTLPGVIANVTKNDSEAEKRTDIRIHDPMFPKDIEPGKVSELSPIGTSVMTVTATDIDDITSEIAYSLIKESPPHGMFGIHKNGTVYVKSSALDREKQDTYTLELKGVDLNGDPKGRTGTATVVVHVEDVNDNGPTLEKEHYEGSIEENTKNVEVMRIKAKDLDLKDTDNWKAVFEIVKGNEAEYFSIKTDPKTNEGILMLDKEVNFEDVQDLKLGLAVKNKAPMHDGSMPNVQLDIGVGAGGPRTVGRCGVGEPTEEPRPELKIYSIKIRVKNLREGPVFDPKIKVITLSEGDTISFDDVIATYTATDEDTGEPAENVKYVKSHDPDNWLLIDPDTAEIKLKKMPDRESPFLKNGTYFAEILCLTYDMPRQTATGTVAVAVEDFNDHCPTLTRTIQTVCHPHDAVIVNAIDEDGYPNGAPFHFNIIAAGTKGKWQVEYLNDTAAILRAEEKLCPGPYDLELNVKDLQGVSCPEPQKMTVQVCRCENGETCVGRVGRAGRTSSRGFLFHPSSSVALLTMWGAWISARGLY